MKIITTLCLLMLANSALSTAQADEVGSQNSEPKLCWHEGKGNSVGAVLNIEKNTKFIRCSKVLIVDKNGDSKEVVGWVEGELSSKGPDGILTFKDK